MVYRGDFNEIKEVSEKNGERVGRKEVLVFLEALLDVCR